MVSIYRYTCMMLLLAHLECHGKMMRSTQQSLLYLQGWNLYYSSVKLRRRSVSCWFKVGVVKSLFWVGLTEYPWLAPHGLMVGAPVEAVENEYTTCDYELRQPLL